MSQRWKTFENLVAQEVSGWLFGDKKILRRSPCSGGWKGRGSDGDVITSDDHRDKEEENPFSIECKCRVGGGDEGWHFEQLLTAKKHPIIDWWSVLSGSGPVVKKGKMRFLVFSKTSGLAVAFVCIGEREVRFLTDARIDLRPIPKIIFEIGRSCDPSYQTDVLRFFKLKDFLEDVDPELVKKAWKERPCQG
jgi:hypothetical protein